MIKILKANNKNYLLNINRFLNYRRSRNRFNNSIVKKILYDVKKNKQNLVTIPKSMLILLKLINL